MSADVTDTRVQAAKALLGGQGRMAAKAQDLTPVQAARDRYGTDVLDAVEDALNDDRVTLTDAVLTALRDGAELDSVTAADTDLNGRTFRLHGVDTDSAPAGPLTEGL
jgi:GTP-sensing pleiotropic transcriptional regulator CodY